MTTVKYPPSWFLELHLLGYLVLCALSYLSLKQIFGTLACFELLVDGGAMCVVTDEMAYRCIHVAFSTYL
jgi:hypothetical protein